jgi:hypothetical protein
MTPQGQFKLKRSSENQKDSWYWLTLGVHLIELRNATAGEALFLGVSAGAFLEDTITWFREGRGEGLSSL